jgi:hypothetical protein
MPRRLGTGSALKSAPKAKVRRKRPAGGAVGRGADTTASRSSQRTGAVGRGADTTTRLVVTKTRPAPKTQPGPFRARERRAVARHKGTPDYRKSIRAAYDEGDIPARQRRLAIIYQRLAEADRRSGSAASERAADSRDVSLSAYLSLPVEDRTLLHLHGSRIARNAVLKEGRARFTGMDDASRRRSSVDVPSSAEIRALTKGKVVKRKRDVGDEVIGAFGDVAGTIARHTAAPLQTQGRRVKAITGVDARPSKLADDFAVTQLQTARATGEDVAAGRFPRTISATARSLPAVAKGAVASSVDLALHPSPGKVRDLATAPLKDLGERAEEARKNPKRYRRRKQEEGAVPELADASIVLPAVSRGVGMGITNATRAIAKPDSRAYRAVSEPRPALRRTAGGPAERQDLSPNAFKIAAQRAVDRSRKRKVVKRKEQAQRDERRPFRGLEPGEGEVVKKSVRAQHRDQRIAVSSDAARGFTRLRKRQATEVSGGIQRDRKEARKKLKRPERQAFDDMETLALQGLVKYGDADGTRELLEGYRARVVESRKANKKLPAIKRSADELDRIDRVLDHLEDGPGARVLPVLAEYHGKQVERHNRLREQDDTIDELTTEVRRWQPVARVLGESDTLDTQITRIEKKLNDGDFGKGEAAKERAAALVDTARRQFVARMRKRAEDEGLPEPVYVLHRPRRTAGFADYTPGGTRTIAGPGRTEYRLFDEGRADTSPAAYEQGIARSIKRSVNWNTVNDILERNAPAWGRGKPIEALRQQIDARDLDPREWVVVDMGLFRRKRNEAGDEERRGDELEAAGDTAIHDAVGNATHTLDAAEASFRGTGQRFVLVNKAVADELREMTKPSGVPGRTVSKVQGLTSRAILQTSPMYLPINVGSNVLLATGGTAGRIVTLPGVRAYRKLDDETKAWVDELLGAAPATDMMRGTRYGAALDTRIVGAYHSFVDKDIVQTARTGRFNPLTWNRRGDEVQNSFFRREAFVTLAKSRNGKALGEVTNELIEDAKRLLRLIHVQVGNEVRHCGDDELSFAANGDDGRGVATHARNARLERCDSRHQRHGAHAGSTAAIGDRSFKSPFTKASPDAIASSITGPMSMFGCSL